MSVPTRRVCRFIVVGCTAAAVHWSVVVALVRAAGLAPLLANVGGWSVAVAVSFGGHHRWTFGDARSPAARAAPRFLLLSAAGFALNEAAFAALLRWTRLPYPVALAAVLAGVAVLTYLLGRHWVFRRRPAR